MSRLNRQVRRFTWLAAALLLSAAWLQLYQPLLLAGHLKTCAVPPACEGACRHADQYADHHAAQRAMPLDAGDRAGDGTSEAGGHDGMHCVLCRVLLVAGKAVAAAVALDLNSAPLVARAVPATVFDGAASDGLDAHAPRAPPFC